MTDKKISELDPATTLDGSELVPIVQDGETVRTTVADIGLSGGSLTVGTTPIASGTSTRVLYEGGGNVLQEDDEFTYDSAGAVTLGKAGGGTGAVKLKGTTSGTVTLSTADAAGTWTMKLPTSGGTVDYLLRTDGSGNTSWVAPPSAGTITVGTTAISGGTAGRVVYEDSSNKFGEASAFTISSGQPNVAAGQSYLYDGYQAIVADLVNFNWYLAYAGDAALTATGTNNLGIGDNSLFALTSGSNNIGLGPGTGQAITSGNSNFALGHNCLATNTTGSSNVAIGNTAMVNGAAPANCIAIGDGALANVTGDNQNVAIGAGGVMGSATSASYSTAVGYGALANNSVNSNNTAVGHTALAAATGSKNIAVGTASGNSITSGSENVIIGYASGSGITTGGQNTIIGSNVGSLSSSLANAVILADGAGQQRFDYGLTTASVATVTADRTDFTGFVKMKGYTIASTLPAAGTAGRRCYVTDSAASPVFGATVTGGGSTIVPVFDDGTNWIYA